MNQLILVFIIFTLATVNVSADCVKNKDGNVVCAMGQCLSNDLGDKKVYCTGLGGGIIADDRNNMYCGIGECVKNQRNYVWCSVIPGGGAAKDSRGDVKCYGGCRRGDKKLCVLGEPGK